MNTTPSWREPLEPVAGGLARLADAVARQNPRSRRSAWPFALGGTLALLLATGVIHHRHEAPQRAFERQWRDALSSLQQERGIRRELPSGRADVRILVVDAPAAPH